MTYWFGAVLAPFAAWLLWQSYHHWQRVNAARAALPASCTPPADENSDPRSLAGFGEIALPIVLTALVFSAVECIAAYKVAGGEKVLSLFDIGVVLATLAAYGLNFTLKVKCRMPKTDNQASNDNAAPVPWPQRLALQALQAEQARLRQPYASESLNKTTNQRLDRLTSA